MHTYIYMRPHSWGAVPSAVMSLVCSSFFFSFRALHGSASPQSNTTHVTDNHNKHQAVTVPNNSTSTQYSTSLRTQQFLVTLSVKVHQNTTFWCPIIIKAVHFTLQTTPPPATTHAQVSSLKHNDVRTAGQHDYRYSN
jgi:hypothetical protein